MRPTFEFNILRSDSRLLVGADLDVTALTVNSVPATLSRLPDAWQASRLWQIYVSWVDPLVKVLHVPTSKPRIQAALSTPNTADDSQTVLLFAIFHAASTTLVPDQFQNR